MNARYNVLLEWDHKDQVWVTYVPTLNWLSTFGTTREEALAQTREAVLGYIQAAKKEGLDIPEPDGKAELDSLEVAV
jgi:predicted RNase H-like HicB family nuclease